MKIEPYKLYNHSELNQYRKRLNSALNLWAAQWSHEDCSDLLLENIYSGKNFYKKFFASSEKVRCYSNQVISILFTDRIRTGLFRLLFAEAPSPEDLECPALDYLLEKSLWELIDILSHEFNASGCGERNCSDTLLSGPAALVIRKGQGFSGGEAKIGQWRFPLMLHPDEARKNESPESGDKINPVSSPVNRRKAIAGQKLALTAELGRIELTLGDLLSLQKGDVVTLAANTADHIALKNTENKVVGKGILGTENGWLAIQLKG